MQIVERNIEELISAEYNPRELTEKQYNNLKDSLKRFGVIDPVIVNVNPERKDIIIGGHQRTKVWKDLGNDTIPTVEVDLTLDKEKELNIRLNKNTGQWDKDALANFFEVEDLIDFGFEEYEFGFTEEVDYSILDSEDLSDEIDGMTSGVKKAVQIEFELDHYEEANELIRWWREQDAYVGGMIMEHLKAEKEKLE